MNETYYCKGCDEKLRMINPTYLICDNPSCDRWDLPTTLNDANKVKEGKK